MTDKNKQLDALYNEKFDIEYKTLEELENLINVGWDSNTVKLKLENLVKQRNKIYDELFKLDEKE